MSFGYKFLIREPTKGDHCLDNIYIRKSNNTHSAGVINMNLSDHTKAVHVNLNVFNLSVDGNQTDSVKFLSKAGLTQLVNNLALVDWVFIASDSPLDDKWSTFINIINKNHEAVVTSKINRKSKPHGATSGRLVYRGVEGLI